MSTNINTLECTVYKSLTKDETYIYLAATDDIADLPGELLAALGKTEKVMDITLTPEKKLARYPGEEVIKSIHEQGFHLQMPENPQLAAIPGFKESLADKNL